MLSPIHLARHRSAVAPLSIRCRTAIATLSLCCCSTVAPLLHRYRYAVAPPLWLRCRAAVAPLSHRYRSTVAPLLLLLMLLHSRTSITPVLIHCRSAAVAPAVSTQLHRYRATVAPLMSLLMSLHSYTVIALLSHHCCYTAVAPALATRSHRYRTAIDPLLHCCRTAVDLAQRRYKQFQIELLLLYCQSTVAYAVDRKVHAVVTSRSIIRVTMTIGDCQARVSSSSEGCLTSEKVVKVETY